MVGAPPSGKKSEPLFVVSVGVVPEVQSLTPGVALTSRVQHKYHHKPMVLFLSVVSIVDLQTKDA